MKRVRIAALVLGLGLAACGAAPAISLPPPSEQPAATQPALPPAERATVRPAPAATPTRASTLAPPTRSGDPAPANSSQIAAEIAGRPTDTSITFSIVPAAPATLFYEYGTSSGACIAQTSPQTAAAGAPLETTLSGLRPDTRYFYRLRAGDTAGPERSFVTQRAPGSAFTFAIQGDSHPERDKNQFNAALYRKTLLSAASVQPDFYMTIGDDFSVDTLKTVNADTVRALYVDQRSYLGLVGAPVFLVNGNHEQAAQANLDGTPNNVAVWAQTARNAYYPQPAPDGFYTGDAEPVPHIGLLRDYYAWTWGDALFVVIDPYWHSPQAVDNTFGAEREEKGKRDLWNNTLGDAQYQWFKRTLETSRAKYKFVFAHHVNGTGRGGIELARTFEWGDAAQYAARRPGWSKTIHQLMVDNRVTIFFQGHDHLFARQELDGVIYQTLPEPANPFYTTENADAYRSGTRLPNSGHVRVAVTPDGVVVTYVRCFLEKPDELAFTYTVR